LLPIVFGLASGQIIALNLPRFLMGPGDGQLTALDSANRLMQLPLAIFASGPAIALFPTLSLLSSENKRDEWREKLTHALRRTILLTLWASALLIALAQPLIALLLQHGQFTASDTRLTALVTMCYAPGILGLAAQQFLARGFYANGETRPPVVIGACCMALFLVVGWITRQLNLGAMGLALSASLSLSVLGVWMSIALRQKIARWDDGATQRVLIRGTLAALCAGAAAFAVASFLTSSLRTTNSHVVGAMLALTGGAVVGTVIFIAVAQVLKIEEISALTSKLNRRK
jgi:putative peptidoglycan lipid II flippase